MKENVNYREHPNPTIPHKPSLWEKLEPARGLVLRLTKILLYVPFVLLWLGLFGWLLLIAAYICTGEKWTWYFPNFRTRYSDEKYFIAPLEWYWSIGE